MDINGYHCCLEQTVFRLTRAGQLTLRSRAVVHAQRSPLPRRRTARELTTPPRDMTRYRGAWPRLIKPQTWTVRSRRVESMHAQLGVAGTGNRGRRWCCGRAAGHMEWSGVEWMKCSGTIDAIPRAEHLFPMQFAPFPKRKSPLSGDVTCGEAPNSKSFQRLSAAWHEVLHRDRQDEVDGVCRSKRTCQGFEAMSS